MDAWSPEQLKKMQLGGNDALNAFLKNYGVDKFIDIRDKYNSQAAEVCSSNQDKHQRHCIVDADTAGVACSTTGTRSEQRLKAGLMCHQRPLPATTA